MPELTPKLGIKKPLGNETVSRAAFNENWDIIDDNVVADKGGTPSIQAGLDAEKPAPGTTGRLYVATDTQIIYRDTGTTWAKVGVVKWGDVDGKPSSFPPSNHKSTHATGGSDELTPADIGAETPAGAQSKVDAHANRTDNPHSVTPADIGAETPAGAQSKVDAHAAQTSTHGATSTATANRIIIRDSAGRAKVAAPAASDDIARKAEVDTHANRTDNPHSVTAAQLGAANILTQVKTVDGTGSGLDADTVDGEHATGIVTNARVKAYFPDTIANILSDHNKANHDVLGIDAKTISNFPPEQLVKSLTVADFQANPATGYNCSNPNVVNDNNTTTYARFDYVDGYAQIIFNDVFAINQFRLCAASSLTDFSGRWQFQYWDKKSKTWIPCKNTQLYQSNWNNWLMLDFVVITDRIRFVCTQVASTTAGKIIYEIEMKYE